MVAAAPEFPVHVLERIARQIGPIGDELLADPAHGRAVLALQEPVHQVTGNQGQFANGLEQRFIEPDGRVLHRAAGQDFSDTDSEIRRMISAVEIPWVRALKLGSTRWLST